MERSKIETVLRVGNELDLYAGAAPARVILKRAEAPVLLPSPGLRPTAKSGFRILLVEDDERLANSVRGEIEQEGGSVVRVRAAENALGLLSQTSFDVVLLDVVLPGKSGLQLLVSMRANGIYTPVLMLSARDSISDRTLGLDSGADDYLVKPFSLPELSARIRALARRNKPEQPKNMKCADLEIDVKTHTAKRTGVPLILTCREFEILEYLCQNLGCVVSREMLIHDVWKEPNRHTPLDNVINVHMARLRQKLDGNYKQKLLHTVRRVGFILRDQAA